MNMKNYDSYKPARLASFLFTKMVIIPTVLLTLFAAVANKILNWIKDIKKKSLDLEDKKKELDTKKQQLDTRKQQLEDEKQHIESRIKYFEDWDWTKDLREKKASFKDEKTAFENKKKSFEDEKTAFEKDKASLEIRENNCLKKAIHLANKETLLLNQEKVLAEVAKSLVDEKRQLDAKEKSLAEKEIDLVFEEQLTEYFNRLERMAQSVEELTGYTERLEGHFEKFEKEEYLETILLQNFQDLTKQLEKQSEYHETMKKYFQNQNKNQPENLEMWTKHIVMLTKHIASQREKILAKQTDRENKREKILADNDQQSINTDLVTTSRASSMEITEPLSGEINSSEKWVHQTKWLCSADYLTSTVALAGRNLAPNIMSTIKEALYSMNMPNSYSLPVIFMVIRTFGIRVDWKEVIPDFISIIQNRKKNGGMMEGVSKHLLVPIVMKRADNADERVSNSQYKIDKLEFKKFKKQILEDENCILLNWNNSTNTETYSPICLTFTGGIIYDSRFNSQHLGTLHNALRAYSQEEESSPLPPHRQ